jgi:transcriptional regulator of arginine metabolism
VLSIIGGRPIATQEELVAALREEGIEASQASVSRDVATLGLVKAGGRYVLPARLPAAGQDRLEQRVREHLQSAAAAGPHMIVLRTAPGEAGLLALAIDGAGRPGVVGTVAGDDTIFVAVTNERSSRELLRELRRSIANL